MENRVGRGYKRASDEEIVAAYKQFGSIWKAAKHLGLAGQSVHERLVRLGVQPAHARWTNEEDQELKSLYADPHLTVAEIAKRLGRTSASVACHAGELGIKKVLAPKHKRVPRGKGYDKQSVAKHIKAIEEFDGTLTKYCRSNGLQVESFAVAAQRGFPDWWINYSAKSDLERISCEYCGEYFFPNNKRQRFCTRKCSSDSKRDRDYFGGNRRTGVGVSERVCQICLKEAIRKVHVHHVYGKTRDPDNKHLVALCSRCHMALEQIVANPDADSNVAWINMMRFAWLKLHGWKEGNQERELRVVLFRDIS